MEATAGPPSSAARAFAWAGALLFVGSLSFFLFSYVVTYGETAPGSATTGRAIAIDVALFTGFALHHSIFARARVRAWMARLVSPRFERAWYVWTASLMLIAVCWLWQPVPGIVWQATGAWRWTLVALQTAGAWLTLRSAAMIDVFELAGVRQLAPGPLAVEFTTSGPYGWVRHPIYTGWFVVVFCVPAMTGTRLVFAVVSSLYLLVAIPFEERSLAAASGGAYLRYVRRVRWKLVPGLY